MEKLTPVCPPLRNILHSHEVYTKPCQTSKMKLFAEIIKVFQLLIIYAKSSILDVRLNTPLHHFLKQFELYTTLGYPNILGPKNCSYKSTKFARLFHLFTTFQQKIISKNLNVINFTLVIF